MRILVYGTGAVGCYLGGFLAHAGHTVIFLGRERITRALTANGLDLRFGQDYLHIPSSEFQTCTELSSAAQSSGKLDLILFTMKAYDTIQAIQELQHQEAMTAPIICFQNGVGNEDDLMSAFGQQRIVAGTVTTAVSMETPGAVVIEKNRGIALATDAPAAPIALEAFQSTAIPTATIANGKSLKWSKLLLNILGNATSAILDQPVAAVFTDRRLFQIEIDALREAVTILRLAGIPVNNLPGAPARALATAVRLLPAWSLYFPLRRQIATGRGNKLPSLLLALRANQSRTEVAWLNGAVAQAAKRMSRLAPINHTLALIVSDISAGRSPWSMYRHRPDMLLTAIHAARGAPHWRYGE